MVRILNKALDYVAANWNTLLAVVSLLGIAVGSLMPWAESSRNFFVFLGLNAVLWTLIEVRSLLVKMASHEAAGSTQFSSMREARTIIVERLARQLGAKGTSVVTIGGGRLRSIAEVLREFQDVLPSLPAASSGLVLNVCCMDPDYCETLELPGAEDAAAQRARRVDQASQVRAIRRELQGMSSSPEFVNRAITVEVTAYKENPFGYFFLFGDDSLLWGGYQWHHETSELQGPSSPCELVERGSARFDMLNDWLTSRAALHSAS
ncbi:MAG: hypothetical protein GY745_01970 [Actinomycetia bacterium]|nr:hypothetical protein [Actinomycetes bacterium]